MYFMISALQQNRDRQRQSSEVPEVVNLRMINLIPRFYDVTEGTDYIGRKRYPHHFTQHDLRDELGYVPQKGVLFSGTIESNILYGNPDGSEAEMKEAAEIAQATEFIEEKHKKYEQSDRTGRFQCIRRSEAASFHCTCDCKEIRRFIFLMTVFQHWIIRRTWHFVRHLKEKTQDSTVIIVAQRISTILHAEQIIVLDDGEDCRNRNT